MSSDFEPSFSALPLRKDGPRGNCWGLYGEEDELGMLNRLTPENTIAATREILSTSQVLHVFVEFRFSSKILNKTPRTVNDDVLTLNTQSSSQWDGFRHFGYQDHKVYFNGCTQADIQSSTKNGIHVWVENGGIVGRGVLLDWVSWAETKGIEVSPLSTQNISAVDLEQVAAAQKVSLKPNDILFVRSGFVRALNSLSAEGANQYAASDPAPKAIGLASTEDTLRWIWERKFAAVAGDMIAFEALPFQSQDFWMHEWLLGGWGLPIGSCLTWKDLQRNVDD